MSYFLLKNVKLKENRISIDNIKRVFQLTAFKIVRE